MTEDNVKGIISGIKRMEIHDGDGLRTTVFFKGCPLKCVWCHNPESIAYQKQVALFQGKCKGCGACENICPSGAVSVQENGYARLDLYKCSLCFRCVSVCPTGALKDFGKEYEVDALADELLRDKAFFDNSGGGVTLSGGECLSQPEFAAALAKKLYENGVCVYVDTCGYVKQEIFEAIIPYTEKFLYDIKAIDSSVHKKCTGRENKLILDNLIYLCKSGCDVEIRYPLVKGYNDGECEKIGAFLEGLEGISRLKVLQYHSFAASRYEALGMENTLPKVVTQKCDVDLAVKILKGFGLNAVSGIDIA